MNKSTKTKLVATIVSMVSAVCLFAVGVMASLTNFQVGISNQLNLNFCAAEGTLYATRIGDVAGTDRTTSKVLSESTTATDWLKVYNGTTEGIQADALTSIQEKVDFISNDAIKEKVNAGTTSIAITYYFYYTLPTDAVANNITLTAPASADSNLAISYLYVKGTGATLPDFTSGTVLTNGETVQVAGGEHLFIKAEAKVDLSKSVKKANADWSFILNFGIATTQSSSVEVKVTDEAIGGNYYYYVELGEYPQTVVEDTATLSALNALGDSAKTGRTFVVGASDDAAQTAHVEYSYNGAKYVKVASAVVNGTDAQYKFSTGTKATSGNTYWFKVEPIKWFLLKAYSTIKTAYTGSTTNLRVISEQLLTANVMFKKENGGNDWVTSNIRTWLNDDFYTSAFSAEDKGYIVKNTTRYFGAASYNMKDDYTVTTGGSTTEDDVWLPSYYEMGNTYYGTNTYLNKNTRKATPTDFAVVNKVGMGSTGCGDYWLRSAGDNVGYACSVNSVGNLDGFYVFITYYGVRPALTISL